MAVLGSIPTSRGQTIYSALYGSLNQRRQIQLTPVVNVRLAKRSNLEARYNYEADRTLSVYYQRNFVDHQSETTTQKCAYYAGVSFGNTRAVNPGFQLWLRNRSVDFFFQNQFLLDPMQSQNSLYTNWSQLMWRMTRQFSIGLSAQVYQPLNEKPGVQYVNSGAAFSLGVKDRFEFSAYGFDLWKSSRSVLLGVAMEW